jgi:hypothetical protein
MLIGPVTSGFYSSQLSQIWTDWPTAQIVHQDNPLLADLGASILLNGVMETGRLRLPPRDGRHVRAGREEDFTRRRGEKDYTVDACGLVSDDTMVRAR